MTRVAILASGTGSNAKSLIDYFSNDSSIEVAVVCSNRKNAEVLAVAQAASIDSFSFSKDDMQEGGLLEKMKSREIDWVLLSGFLVKMSVSRIIKGRKSKFCSINKRL